MFDVNRFVIQKFVPSSRVPLIRESIKKNVPYLYLDFYVSSSRVFFVHVQRQEWRMKYFDNKYNVLRIFFIVQLYLYLISAGEWPRRTPIYV